MRVMILAGHPFAGMPGRQQQMALGLSALGHRVLYLDPFQLEPESGESSRAQLVVRVENERLHVMGRATGAESGPLPETAADAILPASVAQSRGEWQNWAGQVRVLMEKMSQGDLFSSAEPLAAKKAAAQWGDEGVPEIVLVYPPMLIEAVRAASPVPIVFDCEEDFPATAASRALADAYERALSRGLPLVDGLVGVNRYLVESWGTLLRPKVPTAVIEHGVDLKLFRPPSARARQSARKALGFSAGAKLAAYVGRLDARVSYEDLHFLLQEEPDLRLLILGEVNDEGRPILDRLPGERIVVRGPLPQDEAARFLAAADAILIPLRREPHLEPVRGLTLYEYLATGLPVVGTFRRATKAFRDLFYLYTTQEELAAAMRSALSEPGDAPVRRQRIEQAAGADWENRARAMSAFLQEALRARA